MLAIVIFLNGMAVMILEMAGARLLAPELGTSIIVWTSLIGVILASLSLGYWFGGKLADTIVHQEHAKAPSGNKNARAYGILSRLLLLASLSVFFSTALGMFVPGFLGRFFASSLHLGTVCTAVALFSLPSILCGMVSPYAVRLAITDSASAGSVIGRLNATGTVGSILGTFLGGFVLLAWFNTETILLGVAGCLLIAACFVSLRPFLPKIITACLLVTGIVGSATYNNWAKDIGFAEGHPVTIETSYSSMRVARGEQYGREMFFLMTDPGSAQSAMYADAPEELVFEYTNFYGIGTYMKPDAKRILMLGGGGYSVPKWLLGGKSDLNSGTGFSLDVVELDPGMTRVAGEYFKAPLDNPAMTVYHEDARTFVNRKAAELASSRTSQVGEPGQSGQSGMSDQTEQTGTYDLIFSDIFNSWYTVPFHVGTVEAAHNISRILDDDGIFIMNIITAVTGDNGRLLRSIRSAFMESFASVHIFPVQQQYNGTLVQNVMLLATKKAMPLPNPDAEPVPPHIARLLAHRWNAPFPPVENDVPPLRDAFAPVERYTLGFLE